MDHFRRMGALRRGMTRAGLAGLLVTHLLSTEHLHSFPGSSTVQAMMRSAPVIKM